MAFEMCKDGSRVGLLEGYDSIQWLTYSRDSGEFQITTSDPTVAALVQKGSTILELRRVNSGTSPGFAILRAGYSNRNGNGGLCEDSRFTANVAGCEKNGVPMGVYFYCYDQSPEAARITAKHVVNLLKGHKWDYPIYYDVEYEPYNKTCGRVQNTAIIKAALEVLEQAGYYAAVYCSRDFFLNYTNLSSLSGFDKWEAAYTSSDTASVENGLWQYSSKNALGIAGFGSSLDCDVSYKDYPAIMRSAGLNGYEKQAETPVEETPAARLQKIHIGPVSQGDADAILALCKERGLTDPDKKLYSSELV